MPTPARSKLFSAFPSSAMQNRSINQVQLAQLMIAGFRRRSSNYGEARNPLL
jgi:hypothetical protein